MGTWRDYVRRVVPYTPGEQPNRQGMVKLNTNENPYPPSPAVTQALRDVQAGQLRLYPNPSAAQLTQALAARYEVDPSQVFVGVGSDDVLAIAFLTFFNSGKPVFFPDITYSFYPVWADLYGIPYETKPLREDFSLDPADYYPENGGVIFPNPNAPTSRYEALSVLEDVLVHNQDSIVIIDEAYIDFAGESALTLLPEHDNLMVVQTFSKSRSMAGMRIGYAIGSAEMVKAMNDVKFSFNSYTMNQAAIAAGAAALSDELYFRENTEKIRATREKAKEELKKLGFTFPEPCGNFIFAMHQTCPARELFAALREADIFVRYFDKPRIDNYLRITIGTDEQMERLYAFLRAYLHEAEKMRLNQ